MRDQDLRKLVGQYLAGKECRGQDWEAFFKGLPLRRAIERAALALGPEGKKHRHQSRILWEVLQCVADCLVSRERTIAECRDFHSLLRLVEGCRVPGFGPVAVYDTAQRIGIRLGLSPDRVYLHAGTRKGAKNLGLDVSGTILRRKSCRSPCGSWCLMMSRRFCVATKTLSLQGNTHRGAGSRNGVRVAVDAF